MKRRIQTLVLAALMVTVALPVQSAGAKPTIERTIVHKEVKTVYFPDDICGDRAGWTTFTVTYRFIVMDHGNSLHVVFGETGRYVTDFDDPSIEDYSSQFTEAGHFGLTPGGTVVVTSQFHDFPGSIQIHERVVFVEAAGSVKVDSYDLTVTGCP